jgi:hypothetical protein
MSDTYFVISLWACINAEAIFTCRSRRRGASVVASGPEDDILLTIISRRKWGLLGWIFVIECWHSNFREMVDQRKLLLKVQYYYRRADAEDLDVDHWTLKTLETH